MPAQPRIPPLVSTCYIILQSGKLSVLAFINWTNYHSPLSNLFHVQWRNKYCCYYQNTCLRSMLCHVFDSVLGKGASRTLQASAWPCLLCHNVTSVWWYFSVTVPLQCDANSAWQCHFSVITSFQFDATSAWQCHVWITSFQCHGTSAWQCHFSVITSLQCDATSAWQCHFSVITSLRCDATSAWQCHFSVISSLQCDATSSWQCHFRVIMLWFSLWRRNVLLVILNCIVYS